MRALVICALLASPAFAETENATLIKAVKDELARAPKLQLPGVPAPYYLAYQVIDRVQTVIAASFGTVTSHRRTPERYLRTDVRVGDMQLDSSNMFSDSFGFGGGQEIMQIEDEYYALRHEIWAVTDRMYKQAVERLEKKKAALKGRAVNPDRVGDFTAAEAVQYVSPKTNAPVDDKKLEALVSKASAVWKQIGELHEGRAAATVVSEKRLLINTDGSVVTEPRQTIRLTMVLEGQAPDGAKLDHQFATVAPSLDALPSEADLVATAKRMADELVVLGKQPAAEEYTGPVLFEPQAAAQLLRAILVPELSGTPPMTVGERMARMNPKGSALGDKIGKRIVPLDFTIEDNPLIDAVDKRPVVGGYAVDDEGVKAQKVTIVEKGLLKALLMSRAPRKGELKSNGHGRAGLSGDARGMPSNLIVTAGKGLTNAELKRRLIARARADGATYAIIIRQLEEPGLAIQRGSIIFFGGEPQATKVPRPIVAVKVGLDGKETPLRGLGFGQFPLRTLRAISAAGKDRVVYSWLGSANPTARNEQSIPMSLAAPALLFDDLELVKDSGPATKPPPVPRL